MSNNDIALIVKSVRSDVGDAVEAADVHDGYKALALVLAFTGLAETPERLARDHTACGAPTLEDLTRLARSRGREARLLGKRIENNLKGGPIIVEMTDERFIVVAKMSQTEVLAHDPVEGRPLSLPRTAFEAQWSGRALAIRRASRAANSLATDHVAIALTGDEDADAAVERPFGFSWFLPILAKHKLVLIQVSVASFLLQAMGLAIPMFIMVVMDKVLVSKSLATLDMLVIGLAVVGVFELVMGVARAHLHAWSSHRLDVELQARVFRHLSSLPLSYFHTSQVGATAARVRELDAVRAFLTGASVTTMIDLAFTIVFLAVMAFYAWLLTLIVITVVILIFVVYGLVTPALKDRLSKRSRQTADGQAFLVEAVSGIETIKSLAVEPSMRGRWEEHVAAQTRLGFDSERLNQGVTLTVSFLNRVMTVATLWLGAGMVIGGALTAGQLMAFNMMSGRVLAPAQRLAQLWRQFQETRVALKRLAGIMDVRPESRRITSDNLPVAAGRVSFDNVSFRYRADHPLALCNLSFSVATGRMVGIVGSSGSGKSTVARLMQRLYTPESGRIMLDGVDLSLVDMAWLRRSVASVAQDNFLFNRSVRDNIALTDAAMPISRVVQAAELAGAHEFILGLPETYDTIVGERGALLSGGQRQRLALARALATDPRVLILDEATSALDVESEQIIHANMRRIRAGRTVIVIAHRLSAVRDCDAIMVIEGGRLIEQGDHAGLMAAGGRYAALFAIQEGGWREGRRHDVGAE